MKEILNYQLIFVSTSKISQCFLVSRMSTEISIILILSSSFVCVCSRISLYSPGQPRTHRYPPASMSPVQGLKLWATMPDSTVNLLSLFQVNFLLQQLSDCMYVSLFLSFFFLWGGNWGRHVTDLLIKLRCGFICIHHV